MDGSKSTVSQYEPLCPCLYVDEDVGNAHLFGAQCVWGEHQLCMLRVGALQRYKRIWIWSLHQKQNVGTMTLQSWWNQIIFWMWPTLNQYMWRTVLCPAHQFCILSTWTPNSQWSEMIDPCKNSNLLFKRRGGVFTIAKINNQSVQNKRLLDQYDMIYCVIAHFQSFGIEIFCGLWIKLNWTHLWGRKGQKVWKRRE